MQAFLSAYCMPGMRSGTSETHGGPPTGKIDLLSSCRLEMSKRDPDPANQIFGTSISQSMGSPRLFHVLTDLASSLAELFE